MGNSYSYSNDLENQDNQDNQHLNDEQRMHHYLKNTYSDFKDVDIDRKIVVPNLPYDDIFEILDKYAPPKMFSLNTGTLDNYLTYSMDKHNYINDYSYRFMFVKVFGWSIPSHHSINKIMEFVGSDKVLEIAAGRGLWSALLKANGVDIVTTSIIDGHYYSKEHMEPPNTWTDIELLDCEEAVQKYSDRNCLFLSWGYGQLYRSLEHFKGSKLIVVGEPEDGCTDAMPLEPYGNNDNNDNEDNDNNDNKASEDNDNFGFREDREVGRIDIPKWLGIHDSVYLYRR